MVKNRVAVFTISEIVTTAEHVILTAGEWCEIGSWYVRCPHKGSRRLEGVKADTVGKKKFDNIVLVELGV